MSNATALLLVGDPTLDFRNLRAPNRRDASAEAWAINLLTNLFSALPDRGVVLTGGMHLGPERWAVDVMASLRLAAGLQTGKGIELLEIHADGARASLRGDPVAVWRDTPASTEEHASALVGLLVTARSQRWRVVVLALRTDSCSDPLLGAVVSAARREGIEVSEHVLFGDGRTK